MKILGKERALAKEPIILNISLLKEGIANVKLTLSESLSLLTTYNYDLERNFFSKKEILFEVSKFNFENNLALGFISEKLDDTKEHASIKIEALDIEKSIKEMSVFDIEILKPEIHVKITSRNKEGQMNIKLEKRNNEITTYFEGLEISAIDFQTKQKVKVNIVRFSEEEYVDNLDNIPIIFDIETAIKEIVIFSNNKIELTIHACYRDLLGNDYESNKATIKLKPPKESLEEEEFITNPIFNTVGFEMPAIAMASA
jgi:hypothetical protein